MNFTHVILSGVIAIPSAVVAADGGPAPSRSGPPPPVTVLVTPDAAPGAVADAGRRLSAGPVRVWRTGGRLEARGDAAGLLANGARVVAVGSEARAALGEARASR